MRHATPDARQTHAISSPRYVRRWGLKALLVLVLVLVLGLAAPGIGLFAWGGLSLVSLQALQPLPLLFAMVLLPALGLPMTPFYVIAGLRFGIPLGLAFSAVATLLNLMLCYAIACGRLRPLLRDTIERRFPTLAALDRARGDAWRVTLLIKLIPGVPMFIKHYALGIAGVPLSIYLAVALMTTGPYAIAFVVLGKSALEGNVGRMLIAVALLVLIVVTVKMAMGQRMRRGRSRPAGP
ncbi:TVP38/TMEM64 family protein [Salinicola halimionae]|uniref:TVP38/TMEM64 family protein n=1 Tax=Salinicola halimionae TaxID=1949081 RepID=UPI000DA1FE54|nr:VTT domain-containing protein [Salinicola halimionae]